jgi:hypothetical protein
MQWKPVGIFEERKKDKIQEMSSVCEQKIIEGFLASNGHHYRTNRDDQLNMLGKKIDIQDNVNILTVYWKTEDVGYVTHTREEWLQMFKEACHHKELNLFKYNTLKMQVENATTDAEILAVNWD